MMGIGIIELLIIAALLFIPLGIVVVLIVVIATRRSSNHQPLEMPRHCPTCQTSFEPGSAVCPQCGYSLDRP